ncbi:hypothetical protein R1flu_026975 [Riccia fluitans]|uniref:Uncharacterized protein n=1 Tax=Riccia fluitans TaxID=41844 RepID=A0ABD1XHI2_9MARC
MELDWYGRASVNRMSPASSNSRWRTNDNVPDPDKQASRWVSLLNLIQDRGIFSPRSSEKDHFRRSLTFVLLAYFITTISGRNFVEVDEETEWCPLAV